MTDIKSMTYEELKTDLLEKGEKSFRAGQMYDWMHVKLARGFDEMTNLSLGLRDRLKKWYVYTALECVRVQESRIDGTRKFLFELSDGSLVESVLMKYEHGNSVCISSQVGCRMGCSFCASTIGGLKRNLTPSEMLDQIYSISRITGERISNVVVMGCGEPLDNYDNLLKFIRILTDEHGQHISQRSVTVSTCGLVPRMRSLADEKLQITLALSLHAVTDEKRLRLMPVARRYSIAELMDVCGYYVKQTGRRITFEYSLIEGENDSDADARSLIRLAKPLGAHVNLISVNPVRERKYKSESAEKMRHFQQILLRGGVNATVRRTLGSDIDGACGQLRAQYIKTEKTPQAKAQG